MKQALKAVEEKGFVLVDSFTERKTSYKGYISWLLLSTHNQGFLVDASKLHDHLFSLKYLLESPSITKFSLKMGPFLNDVKRDFQIFPCNLMDLEAVEHYYHSNCKNAHKNNGFLHNCEYLYKLLNRPNKYLSERPIS